LFNHQENTVRIQSVALVARPNAPSYQEKIYFARLDSGETVELFQQHWDVSLPPESLVGLTPEEARKRRTEKMLSVAMGHH
jgi:hypothetical protein